MKKNQYVYVKRATAREKALMQVAIDAENEFQQQEPHGWDEDDNDCPIVFRLENHSGYQMQAYTPSGNPMGGFHESFVRCGNCKEIITMSGDGDEFFCYECYADLTDYAF